MSIKKTIEILTVGKIISLVIIGFGVGWLVGLSISPVVSTLISSIVGVTVMLVSIMSGISWYSQKNQKEKINDSKVEEKSKMSQWKVHPAPIAFLVLGIVIGSGVGIYVRTHNILGVSSEEKFVETWKILGKSSEENPIINEQEIVRRVFDNTFPAYSTELNQTVSEKMQNMVIKNDEIGDTFLKSNTLSSSLCGNLIVNAKYKESFNNLVKESDDLNKSLKKSLLEAKSQQEREERIKKLCQ